MASNERFKYACLPTHSKTFRATARLGQEAQSSYARPDFDYDTAAEPCLAPCRYG